MNRLEANRLILAKLAKEIEENTVTRFSQMLYNMRVVVDTPERDWQDDYYLESTILLERMNQYEQTTGDKEAT
jgi:hypothetical protein